MTHQYNRMEFEVLEGGSKIDLPPVILLVHQFLNEWENKKAKRKSFFIYCDDEDTANSFVTTLIPYLNQYALFSAPGTETNPPLNVMEIPKESQVIIHNYHNYKAGVGRARETTMMQNSLKDADAEAFHLVVLRSDQEHSIAKDILAPIWQEAKTTLTLNREQWLNYQLQHAASEAPERDKPKI